MDIVPIDPQNLKKSWNEVKKLCPNLTPWGSKRLMDGLGSDVRYVLIEPDYFCKDHRNLYSNFFSKKFLSRGSKCQRLHFFQGTLPPIESFLSSEKAESLHNAYMGYCVIRPVPERCLGRTIIDPKKISRLNNDETFYLRTAYKTHIYGHKYRVEGYPYTSQDSDATVCAHSALWGLCRYLSERHTEYKEVYPYDLILMTGKSQGRSVPYRGMTYTDYTEILSQFGTHPVIIKAKDNPPTNLKWERFRDICTYVESGFPVLASLSGHVVSLIGHTINYDQRPDHHRASFNDADPYLNPLNNADDEHRFIDSACFLKEFVVVDDNFFPYQFLGYRGDVRNYGRKYQENGGSHEYAIESIFAAVCPLPEKAYMPAEDATKKAKEALKLLLRKNSSLALKGPYVTRIFLTSSSSFKRRKLELLGASDPIAAALAATLVLPHFIWVMELYLLSEYKSGKSCGEVVIDATAGRKDDGVLHLRLANKIYRRIGKASYEVPTASARFQQYTHNLGERR